MYVHVHVGPCPAIRRQHPSPARASLLLRASLQLESVRAHRDLLLHLGGRALAGGGRRGLRAVVPVQDHVRVVQDAGDDVAGRGRGHALGRRHLHRQPDQLHLPAGAGGTRVVRGMRGREGFQFSWRCP